MKYFVFKPEKDPHIEQLNWISFALRRMGTLNVPAAELEELYREFSRTCRSTEWYKILSCDDEEIRSFAYWLADKEVESKEPLPSGNEEK